MNRKRLFMIWVLFAISCLAFAKVTDTTPVLKDTYIFAVKGQDTLALDKYECSLSPDSSARPVVLFAFGGGFRGGDRARSSYVSFFHFLAKQGYVVVSTDYRTALEDSGTEPASEMGFVAALQQAIFTAVEDFYDATGYVIRHAEAWNVNAGQIVAMGSSAGAITVLQAEYELANRTGFARRLPASFRYAGVVSFAGAICSIDAPVWKQQPCPLMLFHGDADRTVPYNRAVLPNVGGLWGSEAIVEQLEKEQTSYYFYRVRNAGHEVADIPMDNNRLDVLSFIDRQVLRGEELAKVAEEKVPGAADVKKDFTIEDYIRNNTPAAAEAPGMEKGEWMKYLPDERPMCKLSIPGTHDSGSTRGGRMLRTQAMDIPGQLLEGIRAFDIRLQKKDGKLGLFHSHAFQGIYWEDDVFPAFIDFLQKHPSETLIVSLKKEGGESADYASLLSASLSNPAYQAYFIQDFRPELKLKDCRGKILFLHRDSAMEDYPGAACVGWADNATCLLTLRSKDGRKGEVLLQDEYQYDSGKDAGKKIEACIRNFDKISAEPASSWRWGISFVSATGLPLGTPLVFANRVNEPVADYLEKAGKRNCGIVFIDFIDRPQGRKLVEYLIKSNIIE